METAKTINVVVNGDRAVEPSEVFSVNLITPTGGVIADGHATGTIVDDEPYASVSGGASVIEGHSGTKSLSFTVTLSTSSDAPVTVDCATADGSATVAGGDYQAKTGTLTFAIGETSKTVTVSVNGDRIGESDEYLSLNLTNSVGSGVATATAYGYITDDEPRISIADARLTEGNSGTKLMTFTVTLSAAYDQAVTVNYATGDSSATVANGDYVARSGTLTFAAGERTKTFTVTIRGDKQKESDESFFALLSGASVNALVTTDYGWGVILNDDAKGSSGGHGKGSR